MEIDKSRIFIADIYWAREEPKNNRENDLEKKAKREVKLNKVYDSALILRLSNGKFIDLAELKGAVDYFALSTAAKFNLSSVWLITSGYVDSFKKNACYYKYLRPAYYNEGKIKLSQVIKEAVSIRKALERDSQKDNEK